MEAPPPAGLRADLSQLAIVHTDELEWQPSPSPTVWRKRLELRGDSERGRVTSVVRYDPESSFPAHDHPEGEEILVLSGVFSDERGDFPAGSYFLNPPGFAHAPHSHEGCVIFVKLRQYADLGVHTRASVCVNARSAAWLQPLEHEGVSTLPLYPPAGAGAYFPERVALWRVPAGTRLAATEHPGGAEMFVLSGRCQDEHGSYRSGSWVRYPPGSRSSLVAHEDCELYRKHGHLAGA
ncbi:cupin domain-containing protein [Haliangium ochraceum]|uniref:Anti-ECFsigma factor, ChrR n=1 Tax=Haliangium ochraceum (strain DSM 14365 / JCM 11303 / SMP-2) TaxID=502025 RepID=D0LL24_HALO1|nr:cupin domain-containing protein [Haliangium ochraceum]ACY16744.1 anti-ECFsigma factor, ChrR [Haliangium ochraceum DSM 14365]